MNKQVEGSSMDEQTEKQLNHLFSLTDNVWTGSKYQILPPEKSEFFCINPLKDLSNRAAENVFDMKNFLFEFDNAPYSEQLEAIKKLESAGINIATAVFSGSKSIHLIISMAEKLTIDYKQSWLALSFEVNRLTRLTPDQACKNPNRLSRLAGAVRSENGTKQELLHVGGFIKNELLLNLINKYDIKCSTNSIAVPMNNSLDIEAFETALLKKQPRLYSRIKMVDTWADSVGMYPQLFRLTTWAIDSIGVPKDVFKQYVRKNIYPALVKAGYPANKLDKPVDNAYDYKE